MWILVLAALLQSDPMEDILRRFSQEKAELRDQASQEIISRWREWSQSDLSKLKNAQGSSDPEVRDRTKDCLDRIIFNRSFPGPLWAAAPKVGQTLKDGTSAEVIAFLDFLDSKWKKKELAAADLLPALVRILADQRPSERYVQNETVGDVAKSLLSVVLPRFSHDSKTEDVQAWWEAHQSKSEKEWYLEDLSASEERLRSLAIARLFALNDKALYPRLFEGLRTLTGDEYFITAIEEAPDLPTETVEAEFRRYLEDHRLFVRFEAAKLVFPIDPRAAVHSICQAPEDPRVRLEGHAWSQIHPIVWWLLASKDPEAYSGLRKLLKRGDFWLRQGVILALRNNIHNNPQPEIDDILAETFSDVESRNESLSTGQAGINTPRICDIAGIVLAERLDLPSDQFDWLFPIKGRNKDLEVIWKAYLKHRGRSPALFVLPGTTPVSREQVIPLLVDLASESTEARDRAIRQLSQLGGGAWPYLEAQIQAREKSDREHLLEGARLFSNTLRSVEGNHEAVNLILPLRKRLHQPLDTDALFQDFVEPWLNDASATSLKVEIMRNPQGVGITLRLAITKRATEERAPDKLKITSEGGMAWIALSQNALGREWEKHLGQLKSEMHEGTDYAFFRTIEMTKYKDK